MFKYINICSTRIKYVTYHLKIRWVLYHTYLSSSMQLTDFFTESHCAPQFTKFSIVPSSKHLKFEGNSVIDYIMGVHLVYIVYFPFLLYIYTLHISWLYIFYTSLLSIDIRIFQSTHAVFLWFSQHWPLILRDQGLFSDPFLEDHAIAIVREYEFHRHAYMVGLSSIYLY